MSYSEENGQVVLRMSREDYELLMTLSWDDRDLTAEEEYRKMANRLNEGNPRYTPYRVEERGRLPHAK